jgi:hypothetical protein
MQMSEVMSGPTRQVLRESDWAEGRMPSTPLEIFRAQVQGAELVQAFRAHTSKLIQ